MPGLTYKEAGVDTEAEDRAIELMKEDVHSTYGPEVIRGSWGPLYSIAKVKSFREPVLVAHTDSVGTKTAIAAAMGKFDTIGYDVVNHCVNDILVQGVEPLLFLDYIASAEHKPEVVAEIVRGVAGACREAGCALVGGETAALPGIYQEDGYDLVGMVVGVVEREEIIDGSNIREGDAVIGLASSGLHTNGFSLVRRIFRKGEFGRFYEELGCTLGEKLLEPHRSYLGGIRRLREKVAVKGLAHITGGSFPANIPRILPEGLAVEMRLDSWEVPSIFRLIQEAGKVEAAEMYGVFNMGIGMVTVVEAEETEEALKALSGEAYVVGRVVRQREERRVIFR